jgi:tape measure domain-containing protein
MLGDTAGGNAQKLESITSAYTKVMLKGKVSMQELNMIANTGVPIYDQLAKSMGITVAEMMEMSKGGKITANDLTGAFQQMTGEGGIFFKGMETSSDTFNMRLLGIKENAGILAGVIGERLLPTAKNFTGAVLDAVQSFTAWIQEGNNFEKTAHNLGTAVAAVTAGLITFIAASKGHAAVTALTVAVRGLMTAITGPAGFAAFAIAGVVAGIGALVAHQKEMNRAGETFAYNLSKTSSEAENLLTEYKKVNGEKEVDLETSKKLIALYPGLADKIDITKASVEEYLAAIKELNRENSINAANEWKKKWEGEQEAAEKAKQAYDNFNEKLEENIRIARAMGDEAAVKKSQETAEVYGDAWLNATDKAKNAAVQINAILKNIGMEFRDGAYVEIPVTIEPDTAGTTAVIEEATDNIKKTFQQMLDAIGKSAAQELGEKINAVQSFLKQRADLERVDGEDRIQFFNDQKDILLGVFKEEGAEREAVSIAVAASILETEQKLRDEAEKTAAKAAEEARRAVKEAGESLKKQLEAIIPLQKQIQSRRIEMVRSFLQQAAELETDDFAQRITFLEGQKAQLLAVETLTQEERVAIEKAANKLIEEERKRLSEIQKQVLQDTLNAAIGTLNNFLDLASSIQEARLDDRLAAFDKNAKEELDILKKKTEAELTNEQLTADEKKKIKKRLAEEEIKIDERQQAERQKITDEYAKKAHNIAVFNKLLSSTESGINTAVAITKALSSLPYPYNIAAAIATGVEGTAQQIKILATPIPSFETGGRFIVPDVSPRRVDGVGLRVNPGEEVNVTPRGMAGQQENTVFQFVFDGRVFAEIINKLARDGELHTLQLAGNL